MKRPKALNLELPKALNLKLEAHDALKPESLHVMPEALNPTF